MNLKPIFTYRFKDSLKSAGIFLGIMAAVMAAAIIGFKYMLARSGGSMSGSISAYGISCCIAFLVFGITTIREDVRLGLQNGTGRLTVFAAEILALAALSALLAAAGEILTALCQAAAEGMERLEIADIFQLIFWPADGKASLTFGQHALSFLCMAALFICSDLAGMLISLMFYRLNKGWTIAVAIGGPLLLLNGLPFLFYRFSGFFSPIFRFIIGAPVNFVITAAAVSVIVGGADLMLLRRAPVRAAK